MYGQAWFAHEPDHREHEESENGFLPRGRIRSKTLERQPV